MVLNDAMKYFLCLEFLLKFYWQITDMQNGGGQQSYENLRNLKIKISNQREFSLISSQFF